MNVNLKLGHMWRSRRILIQRLDIFEKDFIAINKDYLKEFLTEELNFIVNYKDDEEIYSFENEGIRYKIIVKFNTFNKRGFVDLYVNNRKFEYSFLSEYRDITFDKIYWEINKGWSEELRNNRTVPQENKKYWNDELKLVEESYNNNYEKIVQMRNTKREELFNIVTGDDNKEIKYDNLKEFIKSILENIK